LSARDFSSDEVREKQRRIKCRGLLIVYFQHHIRRRAVIERDADPHFLGFFINVDPDQVLVVPVDSPPGRSRKMSDLLADALRSVAKENIKSAAMGKAHECIADRRGSRAAWTYAFPLLHRLPGGRIVFAHLYDVAGAFFQ